MQPYDEERQKSIELAWEQALARNEISAGRVTDEHLRTLGYKEVAPGYFENDPRHPNFSAEDRFLMDHPGIPKIARKRLPRLVPNPKMDALAKRTPAWADNLFSGGEPPTSEPIKTYTSGPRIHVEPITPPGFDNRYTAAWLCRLCRTRMATIPTEKSWIKDVFGLRVVFIFRSPYLCLDCRLMRQPQARSWEAKDYRRFWKAVIALWEGEDYPTMGPWVARLLRVRLWFRRR